MRGTRNKFFIFGTAVLLVLMATLQSSVVAQRTPAADPGNACPGPVVTPPGGRSFTDTTGATRAANDPCISCCFFGVGQNDKSVWRNITPGVNKVVRVNTFGSNFDTLLAIWRRTGNTCPTGTFVPAPTSTCTNGAGVTEVNCNDDAGGTLQSEVAFVTGTGDASTVFFVEVAECTGTANGFGGNLSLSIAVSER